MDKKIINYYITYFSMKQRTNKHSIMNKELICLCYYIIKF